MTTTADRVLAALQSFDCKPTGANKYRSNSPLRPGSNSHGFTLEISADGEHGTWFDHVLNEGNSLYDLAARLNLHVPTKQTTATADQGSKRAYQDLDDYATAHYTPADVFRSAGWSDKVIYQGRPALPFTTATGRRYRFIDGNKPTFKPETTGYVPCWYGLARAVKLASESGQPLVICNGEPSTVAAQHRGIAATATTAGEGKDVPQRLLDELRLVWSGPVIIAQDCDLAGRASALKLAATLRGAGYEVRAVDLNGGKGFDLADFVHLHGPDAVKALQALADLAEASTVSTAPSGVLLADVQAEQVKWLWPGRIPFGKLTVIDGDPGLGKSAMTLDLAARQSAGNPLPDGTPLAAAGIVLLSAEDGLADTIRPRLEAAGGDLGRILALPLIPDADGERLPAIPLDIPVIEEAVSRMKAALVVIDPLMAFLGGDVHAFRDQDVRRALAPLAAMAERTGVAMVVVRHLNKAPGGSPLYRGGGSIGIIGAARSGLLVAADPEDPERRILASTKSNLGPPPSALAYRLEGTLSGSVRVVWLGETDHTASKLLSAPSGEEERSALDEATGVLSDILSSGPVSADDVKRQAREAGITTATLRRAKATLGVRSEKVGFPPATKWMWVLSKGAQEEAENPKDAHIKVMSTFGGDEHLWEEATPATPAAPTLAPGVEQPRIIPDRIDQETYDAFIRAGKDHNEAAELTRAAMQERAAPVQTDYDHDRQRELEARQYMADGNWRAARKATDRIRSRKQQADMHMEIEKAKAASGVTP